MYGIDLKKMLDDMMRDKEYYKKYKPTIMFITDDVEEVQHIFTSLVNLYGDYAIGDWGYYEFSFFCVVINCTNRKKPSTLIGCHCIILFYIYTKFNRNILPEILPCLSPKGKFITISKEPTGNYKPTCNEIVNNITQNREDDISEIECLFNTWHTTKKYRI